MHFYCQLAYEHIPYTSPVSPKGTIADNGCGVCAASMVAEHLLGIDYPVEECAKLAKACGSREGYGTDLYIFSPAFAEAVGLHYEKTFDSKEAYDFLEKGKGVVIANTSGNKEDWIGVFSDSGHYIVLCGAENGRVAVWDPMYDPKLNPDRYEIPGRKGKVILDGCTAYADYSVVENDCRDRHYFMFWTDSDKKQTIDMKY